MSHVILGISAYYHDSAAVVLKDGEIIAAVQEERFTRVKHDDSFPEKAIQYVLNEAGLNLEDLSCIIFYDKPYIKFERLLETYHAFSPKGLKSFLASIPVWIKEKLFMKNILKQEFKKFGNNIPKIFFSEHHLSHAASAFYPSPFQESAILVIDGVGEWATTSIAYGKDNNIKLLKQLSFPHSLGLLYSSFTYYCGFKVNSGEYKLMGLAPYGNKGSSEVEQFKNIILEHLVDLREDGSFLLNMDYFNYATGLTMCKNKKWEELFNLKKREAESELSQEYMNLALAIQEITEDIIIKLAKKAQKITGSNYLVMAGGVALNCVANGKLLKSNIFKDIWIQPAAGDAGGALGAAYVGWYLEYKKNRCVQDKSDFMKGSYLGPSYNLRDIFKLQNKYDAQYDEYQDFDRLCDQVSDLIQNGNIIGWFQNRMEYGPRALGNRSILGDPRNPEMQKKINLKIKYREGFRPFAPAILEEDIDKYFELDGLSPYMLLVTLVKKEIRKSLPKNYNSFDLYKKLYYQRSSIPSITHVDYSARVQSVSKSTNKKFWLLINKFKEKTNCPILINTSFNIRGEPIVCTPQEAYECFMKTEMDYLVINNCLFAKNDQPDWKDKIQENDFLNSD